ncbi:MAG: transcriptional repressor [Pseudomonadales bacterium]|nr:transcriptional repressor [Pseudomonadales bacterium]
MTQQPAIRTEEILQLAESHCKNRGTRLTEKRKQVLAGLLASQKALSAYELGDYCRDNLGFQLPAMSIYRILEFLEDEDLVHRLDLAKKYVACSHIACDHAHEQPQFLICKSCFRVQEISIDRSLMNTLNKAVKDVGFSLASRQLEFDCFCGECSG